jgi:hypothetical protein
MALINKLIGLIKYRGITFPRALEDPSELAWPEGWEPLHYDEIPKFTRELRRELCADHILYKVPACALGRRRDADDFLFQIESLSGRFAIVHLTWQKETDPKWPNTSLYGSFEACFGNDNP